jgi:hypothetical protein
VEAVKGGNHRVAETLRADTENGNNGKALAAEDAEVTENSRLAGAAPLDPAVIVLSVNSVAEVVAVLREAPYLRVSVARAVFVR